MNASGHTKVAWLFDLPCGGWGLRGDSYLWMEMGEVLGSQPIPATTHELVALITGCFKDLTGESLDSAKESVFVERHKHFGMSAGHVSLEAWRNRLVPIVVERYQAYQAGAHNRDEMISLVVREMYSARILNNSHRGDLVEAMVLAALGQDWRLVGLGWHPWDLQKGSGDDRVRIQVKQSAALQLWGPRKSASIDLGWKKKPPAYFFRDNPGEKIEDEGRFCEILVVGLHSGTDPRTVDQVDPNQWEFLVIPTSALKPRAKTMALSRALKRWQPVPWARLRENVETTIEKL